MGCTTPQCRTNTHKVNDGFCRRCRIMMKAHVADVRQHTLNILERLTEDTTRDVVYEGLFCFLNTALLEGRPDEALLGFKAWLKTLVEREQARALVSTLPRDVRDCLITPLTEIISRAEKMICVLDLCE